MMYNVCVVVMVGVRVFRHELDVFAPTQNLARSFAVDAVQAMYPHVEDLYVLTVQFV